MIKISNNRLRRQSGQALVTTVVLSGIMGLSVVSMLQLGSFRAKTQDDRRSWTQSYYHAENAVDWAAQVIADSDESGTNASYIASYATSDGSLSLPYMLGGNAERFEGARVTIANHPSGTFNLYQITASAKVNGKVRTIQTTTRKNPPSKVFDYEYFLNNWGWWWGSSITGNGDNRANWDFDFKYNPTVNGAVLANGQIESNGNPVDPFAGSPPFNGTAGSDPVSYVHSGVPRVQMPNLLDFNYYKQKATSEGGKLYVGNTLLVDAVQNDGSKPGLFLEGTTSNPIRVEGPVVIPGDVVISGTITGKGTLYVGGNLYIAGNMTYKQGPNFNNPPTGQTQAAQDAWVNAAINGGKDLIGFAVKESILAGAVNTSHWVANCYNPSGYGLRNVGAEANLGQDGIPHTPDDGVNYLDTNDDGVPDSAWYDADEDGLIDSAYDYNSDIAMTTSRANKILGYPTYSNGSPRNFNDVSSNSMNRLDGIFYTNHAAAMRLGTSHAVMNGALICRDEAIIFSSTLKFNYDPRIHSRYSADPNRYIDLGLPIAVRARHEHVQEIAPITAGL